MYITKTRIDIRKEAMPFMNELHNQLRETVNLSIREGDEMVYVERVTAEHSAIRVAHLVGAKAPLHVTAVGKIFLIEDGKNETLNYVKRNGLKVFTKNTIKDSQTLFTELEKIKSQRYAFDNEEAEPGVSCIGAGIYDDSGSLVAGLSKSRTEDGGDPSAGKSWQQNRTRHVLSSQAWG